LRELFQGTGAIDVDSLMMYVSYVDPLKDDDEMMDWLWSIIGLFDYEMKRKVTKFVTGIPTMPIGGFGYYRARINVHQGLH
jgi:hypothetical protein